MTPAEVVNVQFAAHNRRDVAAFARQPVGSFSHRQQGCGSRAVLEVDADHIWDAFRATFC